MEPFKEVADEDRERFDAVKEEVDRKATSIYVHKILSEAEEELAYWRNNRDVILEITAELEKAESQEVGEAFFTRLGDLLSRIKSKIPDKPDPKKCKDFVRRIYESDGMEGLKESVHSEICQGHWDDPLSDGIDEAIRRSEAEVNRITDIIEHKSLKDAVSELSAPGAYHEIWNIKQNILKTEYGIDWKNPDEVLPF